MTRTSWRRADAPANAPRANTTSGQMPLRPAATTGQERRRGRRRRPQQALAEQLARAPRQGSTGRDRHEEQQAQHDGHGHGVEEGTAYGQARAVDHLRRTGGKRSPTGRRRQRRRTSRLLARKAPWRDSGAATVPGLWNRSPRQASRPEAGGHGKPEEHQQAGADAPVSVKECTETSTPDRVKNVPRMVRLKVAGPARGSRPAACRGVAGPWRSAGRRYRSATGEGQSFPPGPRTSSHPNRAPGSSTTLPAPRRP